MSCSRKTHTSAYAAARKMADLSAGVLAEAVDDGKFAGGVKGAGLAKHEGVADLGEPGGHGEHGHTHRQRL